MRELRFDGLSPDGSRLVLAGNDGQKWSVVIDERIEAAVRRDRARIAQVEIEQAGQLRPREIQARIRAGATAEDVAASSGLSLEHVRRFEGPVLTERHWVAQQAHRTEVRRPGGDIALSDLVAERAESAGVNPADIHWDAWRRDDGIWVVIATFPIEPNTHVATWTYDSGSRTMTVVDDNARSLSAIDPETPLQLAAFRAPLASVAASESEGSDGLVDPPAIIRALRSWRDDTSGADGELGDSAADVPAEHSEDQDQALDSDAELAQDLEEWVSEADSVDLEEAESAADEPDDQAQGPDAEDSDRGVGPTVDAEDVPLFDAGPTPAPQRPGSRPSIPSFDDILFGPGPNAQ